MKLSRRGWAAVALGLLLVFAAWYAGFARPSIGVAITSRSMSHADQDLPGVLDPGERISVDGVAGPDDLFTYGAGKGAGHRVGDDWGDVIAFQSRVGGRNGDLGIVHRAMAWVVYNRTADAYDVPELGVLGARSFVFPEVGVWRAELGRYVHEPMEVVLEPDLAGRHDGFLTKGDHNEVFDQDARVEPDELGHVELVEVAYVNGKVAGFSEKERTFLLFWVAAGAALVLTVAILLLRRPGSRLLRKAGACAGCGAKMAPGAAFCVACGRDR